MMARMSVKLGLANHPKRAERPVPAGAGIQQVPELHENEDGEEGALGVALLSAAVIEIRVKHQ